MVSFDWDSAALSGRALLVLDEIMRHYNAGRVSTSSNSRLEILGHTDRSGPAAYNFALSRRRSEVVGAELVKLGYSKPIELQWFGETRPQVPTADGVREPVNRRVDFRFL